ncbi:hypothetical protein D3C76_1725530 [compost metagenome]
MGQIQNGLGNSFEGQTPDLIEHKRQYDGRREAKGNVIQAQHNGISQNFVKIRGLK